MKKLYENEGKELTEIFKKAKSLGVTTSLDMSIPDPSSESGRVNWKKVLENTLPYVDIYLPSVEETMYMISRADFDDLNEKASGHDMLENLDMNKLQTLGKRLIEMGTKIAVIKCGVHGYYIRTAGSEIISNMGKATPEDIMGWSNRELHEESFHVKKIAAATGSGDSSIAGFLSSFLRGFHIEECIRIACAVGGQNVQVFDAVSGIKTWEETLNMIPDWKKNRHEISGNYWSYDTVKGVWYSEEDSKYNF